MKKAQLRTPLGNVTTYDELKTAFVENTTSNTQTLPTVSPAAIAQSLVALNCYKSSPVQSCSCPKSMCTCCIL